MKSSWTPKIDQRDELDRAIKQTSVLREWDALRRRGVVDEVEFRAMKARLLGRTAKSVSVSDDDDDDDDDDTQRWASRHVAFQNKPRPLLQPLEQRLLRTTPIKRPPPQRPPHSTGAMSRPATAGAAASEVDVNALAFVPSRGAWSERPEDIDERRPHTRGEAQERDFLSIGMASPPARSMDNSPWNSSTNAWRPGSSVPSNVRRPWQAGDAVAPAPPRRRRRRATTRVALAPPRSVRNVAAPAPWGHHRMVGGLFPPAPLEGRHGVPAGGAARKYRT